MDALNLVSNLISGSLNANQHPVTRPDFLLQYEQKNITADVAPYLLSVVYTDYLAEQSDELQIEFEDVDGRWLRNWYPEQGDKLTMSMGDQFTGLIKWGSFEIAEIEYNQESSGNRVLLKALATGVSKANRTNQPKSYEKTTLAQIVRTVAKRLNLNVSGTVREIKIDRVTQYQERDVEFLTRLAKDYGHSFKIVGDTLVFADRAELVEREAVAVLDPTDVLRVRLRDLIKGVPQAVEIRGYDPKTKKTVTSTKHAKPRRKSAKKPTTTDTLKITANKGESQAQLDQRAQSALDDAQDEQCAGTITLFGNAKVVAGQMIELKRYGKLSGRYLVKQARHEYNRASGYLTEIEVKMIEYIDEEKEQQNVQAA